MKLGQNFVKYFIHFLGDGVSRKNPFDIYCPLGDAHLNFCVIAMGLDQEKKDKGMRLQFHFFIFD